MVTPVVALLLAPHVGDALAFRRLVSRHHKRTENPGIYQKARFMKNPFPGIIVFMVNVRRGW